MGVRIVLFLIASGMARSQTSTSSPSASDLAKQIQEMNAVILRLQHRVDELETRLGSTAAPQGAATSQTAQAIQPASAPSQQITATQPAISDLLRGTSLNAVLDTYYGYNFNEPIGRVNRLRAYDVLSNAFSINQAAVIFENAPDVIAGKRWGVRLDLQFGQATETLQGNAANELRPEIYRNIFQAYGTYVVPLGKGLTVDFGKWASSLGIEGNYTKDQMNYSRSYWFSYLPFYHMGARLNYPLTNAWTLNYWVTNGTQQTEPFNNFKDELVGFVFQPNQKLSWTFNYYLGQEHPDVTLAPDSTNPDWPTLQGRPFLPIQNAPKGKLHVLDSYATWQATTKLSFALETDYVIQRLLTHSSPNSVWGGAGYARYQISPRVAIAGRAEYLADEGGLFSGAAQALKETTLTVEQRLADSFLMRGEWRRDFSNQPYFYTNLLGAFKREQNTATLGVVWWFGPKKGTW